MKIQKSKSNTSKTGLIIGIAILLLIIGGVAAYALLPKADNKANQKPDNHSSAQQHTDHKDPNSPDSDTPPPANGSATKEYILLTENEQFRIQQQKGTTSYAITLYPIVNNPEQYSTYQDQLREYKQAALDYLKQQGVNIDKATISYDPSEAANL